MESAENTTLPFENDVDFYCRRNDPTSQELISNLTDWSIAVLVILCIFAALSLVVYIEEIFFLFRNFPNTSRRSKTIWILALFPVFSITALLAVLVPRSSTIIDIVANAFFATCLYQFVGLISQYLGGRMATYELLSHPRLIPLNVPPVCCCICLPQIYLNKNVYQRLQLCAIQFAIFRPLLMFIAAVLWSNGSYVAGSISPRGAALYIALLNILTTMVAMYGLMLMKRAFYLELNDRYRLSWKVGLFQLTLAVSVLPRLIANILVTANVIKCTALLPSKGRGEVIHHVITTIIMSLFGVLGHFAFRRRGDAADYSAYSSCTASCTLSPSPPTLVLNPVQVPPQNNSDLKINAASSKASTALVLSSSQVPPLDNGDLKLSMTTSNGSTLDPGLVLSSSERPSDMTDNNCDLHGQLHIPYHTTECENNCTCRL